MMSEISDGEQEPRQEVIDFIAEILYTARQVYYRSVPDRNDDGGEVFSQIKREATRLREAKGHAWLEFEYAAALVYDALGLDLTEEPS